jgi:hypothetical protein
MPVILDACNLETVADLIEMYFRLGLDLFRFETVRGQGGSEGHGETSGVGRSDQLLRIRSFAFLESRAE